jgi:hypothetical protein
VKRDVLAFAIAIALGVAACMVAVGCGSVATIEQLDAGVDVAAGDAGDLDSMLSPELAPDRQGDVEQLDAAADAAVEVGPSCSWDCRAFCDCGALPCCHASGAADCCSR